MAANNRIEGGAGLNRDQLVSFRFNGKSYQGFDGDTLASALLANGVTLTARSFKYHRPRGIVGNGYEEPSSLVELIGDEQSGNQPITRVRVRPGLEAKSVNCWPSPDFDLMAINRLFARMIPAAFYYKTFKWPDWRLFEPSIRRAAGLAAAPAEIRHQGHYETRHAHCDILIVGAGPAGLLAALLAANSGARVLLADDGETPGGSLQNQKVDIDGAPSADWVANVTAQLDRHENVTRLTQASVWAYREHNLVVITERAPREASVFQRSWRVRARRVIVATGAIERHLVFGHNDRPGVMLASAVQAYVNRYAVRPGKRVVLFGNNNSIYRVGADLRTAGVAVAAIVDSRAAPDADSVALADGIEVFGHHVIEKTGGGKRITSVTLQDRSSGSRRVLACDLLGVSGGWNPTLHLYSQSRSRLEYDARLATFVPGEALQDCCCIGATAGAFTLVDCFDDAARKTRDALAQLDIDADDGIVTPTVEAQPDYAIEALWHVDVDDALASKSFVDIQNDVTLADVHLAMREGFGAVEHVKRYTTAGMGIDQGKTGNLNVIGAIANASGSGFDEIGMTTFRSPYVPIEFGAMTGIREGSVYLPYRHTPITQWNKDNGAFMYEAGARWRRPGYYPRPGESFQQTVNRESLAVRDKVAVYDGAPLGKFEIKGPDAEKLIEMLYTSNFASLKTGMGRYGIMLSDDGLILDDGVTFKLADNHYLISTSTGHADAVNRHMEFFLQTHRPEWRVKITTVTTQWANATVCGPRAREVLQALGTDIDLSPESFPFMAMRAANVAGIAAKICRVSFTGELSFEINVRPRHALQLWQAVIEAGKPFDLTPIGSEANHVLRVEKGFLSLGHEVDGTTDPYDLGMGWIMSKTKADYLGKRALEIRRSSARTRHELVGLLPDDAEQMLDENAPLTPGGRREASEGLVTACVWSVVQKRVIALSLLKDGRNRIGDKVHIRMKDRVVSAEVTAPCFHDPDGALLRS
jgi:sarcosine oxidase subunit alpha